MLTAGAITITMQSVTANTYELGRRWGRITRPLRVVCIALPITLFGLLAWADYHFELERTRHDVLTSTNAVAEHAGMVIESASQVLGRVLAYIGDQDWESLAASPAMHAYLDHVRREVPQVEAVYLIDPDGRLAASSRGYPMPRYDVHTQEYFASAKAQNGDDIIVTAPSSETFSGTTGFMISRRRVRNGVFDGVVGVTVSRGYFDNFYRAILDDPSASAAGLVRLDGALLVRFPPLGHETVVPASNPALMAALDGADSGLISGPSSFDGRQCITGFKRLRGLPILAGYEIDRSVVLTNWSLHAAVAAACAVLLSVLLLLAESVVRRKTTAEHDALGKLVVETERRRDAEARAQQGQKMEALGRLTGGVAHDFNNLLAVILASLELVLRRETEPRAIRLLQAATQAAERGAKLTAQMLAFSRKQQVTVQSVDANAVVQGMDDLLRRTLGPSVRLYYDLDPAVPPALADSMQLELALLNLAVNARDAMPNGGDLTFRTGVVSMQDADNAAEYVRIQVIDTGVGMSEEVSARALEPFFTTKAPGGGTGLGLSMVAGFVAELGGTLSVESAPGSGTTISLALRKSDTLPDAVTTDSDSDVPYTRCRVLLVDDDTSVRASIRAMLEEMGHDVVDATGGAEALHILESDQQFDVLIVDFAMPLMNGAQLAGQVTRLWPDAPILFMTGYVENDELRPWSDTGYRTVKKPFTTQELAMAIERAVRHSPAAAM
jgi:two-component system NtrC family sensor kinase